MDRYIIYKDTDKNFYIARKERSLNTKEFIKLSKEDEKFFDRRKANKLDKDMLEALTELNKAYEEAAITRL